MLDDLSCMRCSQAVHIGGQKAAGESFVAEVLPLDTIEAGLAARKMSPESVFVRHFDSGFDNCRNSATLSEPFFQAFTSD